MSAPAFTPGPWQYLRSPSGPIRVGPSHNCTVAVAPFPPTGDQEANARLIAASPDLYAALRDATDALDYVHAIDSVTPPECDPDDGLCGAQFCAQNGCLVRKIAVARTALAAAKGEWT